jgi:hypothetical protein
LAEIKDAAEKSGVATPAAISALAYNDAAIEDAADTAERTGLIGLSLLVYRKFLGAVIGGIKKGAATALGKVERGCARSATMRGKEPKLASSRRRRLYRQLLC